MLKTSYNDNLGKNYQVKDIEKNDMRYLKIFDLDLYNRYWRSEDDFLEYSYGTIINYKSTPVCICYASCIVNNIAEIDIATLPDWQGKGLAKIVAETFIEKSIMKGIKPNWDCFEDNIPSIKTALSLGFTKLKEYWFLSIYIKTRDNEN